MLQWSVEWRMWWLLTASASNVCTTDWTIFKWGVIKYSTTGVSWLWVISCTISLASYTCNSCYVREVPHTPPRTSAKWFRLPITFHSINRNTSQNTESNNSDISATYGCLHQLPITHIALHAMTVNWWIVEVILRSIRISNACSRSSCNVNVTVWYVTVIIQYVLWSKY